MSFQIHAGSSLARRAIQGLNETVSAAAEKANLRPGLNFPAPPSDLNPYAWYLELIHHELYLSTSRGFRARLILFYCLIIIGLPASLLHLYLCVDQARSSGKELYIWKRTRKDLGVGNIIITNSKLVFALCVPILVVYMTVYEQQGWTAFVQGGSQRLFVQLQVYQALPVLFIGYCISRSSFAALLLLRSSTGSYGPRVFRWFNRAYIWIGMFWLVVIFGTCIWHSVQVDRYWRGVYGYLDCRNYLSAQSLSWNGSTSPRDEQVLNAYVNGFQHRRQAYRIAGAVQYGIMMPYAVLIAGVNSSTIILARFIKIQIEQHVDRLTKVAALWPEMSFVDSTLSFRCQDAPPTSYRRIELGIELEHLPPIVEQDEEAVAVAQIGKSPHPPPVPLKMSNIRELAYNPKESTLEQKEAFTIVELDKAKKELMVIGFFVTIFAVGCIGVAAYVSYTYLDGSFFTSWARFESHVFAFSWAIVFCGAPLLATLLFMQLRARIQRARVESNNQETKADLSPSASASSRDLDVVDVVDL